VTRAERHVERLRRDARRLGLPLPDRSEIEELLVAAASRAFGSDSGIIRIDWSRAEHAPEPRLTASHRALGPVQEAWRAITARTLHPGPEPNGGAKAIGFEAYERARSEKCEAGVDEALLFDAHDRLVEGARSNLVLVGEEGLPLTPALELGPVEGLALEIAREGLPELRFARITREEVSRAREIVAVNAVRGAVAIVELDGRAVGAGKSAEMFARLRAILAYDRPHHRMSPSVARRRGR